MIEILNARENRWHFSNELIETYNCPLVLITLNIPGIEKSKNRYINAHTNLEKDFIEFMKSFSIDIICKKKKVTADGPESYMILDESGETIKRKAVEFEESHILGRIADIDVRERNRNWSRSDLNIAPRKCLICDDLARNCIVSGKHELNELLKKIDEIIELFEMGDEHG